METLLHNHFLSWKENSCLFTSRNSLLELHSVHIFLVVFLFQNVMAQLQSQESTQTLGVMNGSNNRNF